METADADLKGVDLHGEYKWDEKLKVSPPESSWKENFEDSNNIPCFPYLKEYIKLALIAYKDHKEHLTEAQASHVSMSMKALIDAYKKLNLRRNKENPGLAEGTGLSANENPTSELGGVPAGFEFLARAKNSSTGNGYFGVAYVNRKARQIIVSHRGTIPSNIGAVNTDVRSIWGCSYSQQISSALTFVQIIISYAQKFNCQLFFTGHSLGAWLAQLTCFSAKYLTVNADSCNFIRKPSEQWDDIHPFTVVFDSPGALEFLQKIKSELFPHNDMESQQQVNVSCLPVEVYYLYFWEFARDNMKDGELLHIAVEIGSLTGVQMVSWPGYLNWINLDGMTALDLAMEFWGPTHQITLYLEERISAIKCHKN